jgi:hypothetical protein
MPYIVTAQQPEPLAPFDRPRAMIETASTAVATLDEAREAAWAAAGWTADAPDTPGGIHDMRRNHGGFKSQSGGTVGPLPDGTVIEVRQVDGMTLRGLAQAPAVWTEAEAIDAYNAR